ncbi:MAG TPA: hypothetical protein VL026_12780 [Rhizomicrobium sp.]|nr:hypothetical protein [Rhizomicrobium sp.]
MSQALVTIAAPLRTSKISEAVQLIAQLGNPATPNVAGALDRLDGDDGVHFASLHALAPTDVERDVGHLVLEFSADGDDDTAIARMADRIGAALLPIFRLADDWKEKDLATYLKAHKVRLGQGWMGQAGIAFSGTPDMSVGRVRKEAQLAEHVAALVGAQDGGLGALDRLYRIRAALRNDNTHKWALQTPVSLPQPPASTGVSFIPAIVRAFFETYLWPLAIPVLIVLGFGAYDAALALHGIMAAPDSWLMKLWLTVGAVWSGLLWLLGVVLAFVIPVLVLVVVLYASLRNKETNDWVDERGPERATLRKILENENRIAHNHMVSVTTIKPGFTRMVTLRLAFWIVGQLARLQFKPGRLGDIGTIHFARWVTLPGSRDLVFFSNFGGSWESYLEDFITKAHNGLTAVWSNTVGFPRAENLFQKGATDGEMFKRFARRSMVPTWFWYSAYPSLTADNIRINAAIRCGLAAAMTEEEAVTWLSQFGSAVRPAAKLESNQIQSLVFGGLGFMPFGTLLLIDFDENTPATRGWLRDIRPEIAFDDGRRLEREAVLTLAFGPGALAKAGLPAHALETFPPAFLDGMTGPGRARILGDDATDPDQPWWWRQNGSYDAALLVYGANQASTDQLVEKIRTITEGFGHTVSRTTQLHPIPANKRERIEPFGFIDGTSQPIIRGTYRSLRNADPIHLVEPGEFILGYPDNRGNIPPGPTLSALDDPENRLPIRCDNTSGFTDNVVELPREIGRNGSFLVIRQLEQDHDAFWAYCENEAARLRGRLGEPYRITPEFIGAKLVGRWPDGSSLARNPYRSFTDSGDREQHVTRRPATSPDDMQVISMAPTPEAAVAAPGVDAKSRTPRGNPEDNDFLFGTEDPQGLRCPFGAHIRRANPRDSFDPGSQDQIDISNRHRILRIGRAYVAQEGENNGLMFMCLNGDIERQFEFVQQTWMGSEAFHGLSGERDPLAGNKAGCPNGFTIPTREGPVRLASMSRFVTPRGGGYFFLPGKALLEFLSE